MCEEVLELLEQEKGLGKDMLSLIENEQIEVKELSFQIVNMGTMITMLEKCIPAVLYKQYKDFFTAFSVFCGQCRNLDFFRVNKEQMISSLELFVECMEELEHNYMVRVKECPCCGHVVMYKPLSDYYNEMQKRYHLRTVRSETLNREEYSCPDCGASDRDRLIISFLKKEGLKGAAEGTRVLQIAPTAIISGWITLHCPHIKYETTDLYMENVSYQSDIMNMEMISDETYDVIICSHVLEHVQDDRKALREMRRILKPEGKIIFLVPIDLDAAGIDEEWGLPEEENWRRFGQGDHCRMYDKKGLLQRLEEQFYVHCLGRDYFGDEVFHQSALSDTSILYILVKSPEVSLNMSEKIIIDEKLCREGPLVSVILPCYNHEQFVAEAIESVIHQSYKNIEIIVADDASTDNTAAIMRKYSSYFTKELYLTVNTGGEVCYDLKQYARGKYIALMHSDDVWDKDKLALQVAYLEKHAECGACLTWCLYTDEHLKEMNNNIFIKRNRSSQEWINFFWNEGNAFCNPSSLIRREIDSKLKRKAVRQIPDFLTWIDVVQETSVHIIPKVLVRMRWHPKGQSENMSAATKENQYRYLLEEGGGWLGVIRDMENNFFRSAFASVMRNPDAETEEALQCEKYFLMLSHTNPFVQNSAMSYFQEIYDDVQECMEKEYHYTRIDFANDMLTKGLAGYFLKK